jgi:hypothetical protein
MRKEGHCGPRVIEPPILAALTAISPQPAVLPRRSAFHHAPCRVQKRRLALPDEVSRPAFSEPSALSLRCGCRFVLRATCLAEPCSGPSVGRTDPRSIPCLEPNGSRLIIQEIFWIALMSYRIGCRKATMARATPARSGCGSCGANPAADNKAVTAPAWPIPTSRTSAPPGRSTRAASAAIAR